MATPRYLNELISYKELYGTDGTEEEAKLLIRGITSASLLYKFAHVNLYFYLSQPGPESKALQLEMLRGFLPFCSRDFTALLLREINRVENAGNWPAIFWEHSTLLLFDLILRNPVPGPVGMLSDQQTENILKAYLIINSETNNRFTITEADVADAIKKDALEDIFLTHFIYQRDYASNLDFSNQIDRGISFFQYLENAADFKSYVPGFYHSLHVKDYKDLLYNILLVWGQTEIHGKVGNRRAQLSFSTIKDLSNLPFIDTLAINDLLDHYQSDNSFKLIREHPLFKIGPTEYILLDINFLMDHLYKAQVFAFNKYLAQNGFRGNFLAVKGKDFMEDIFLRAVMTRCFPAYLTLSGDVARMTNGDELCDYYIRDNNNLLLIEFKDVLLNADIKSGAVKADLDKELDKKFSANQAGSAKGITQLFNAANYLERQDITKDRLDRTAVTEVFPVVVYTDRSFGQDGLNKVFDAKFQSLLRTKTYRDLHVHNVTFINLNYFEMHERYLSGAIIDLFTLIKAYHEYALTEGQSLTPFEVFSRSYFDEYNLPNITENPLFKQNLALIMPDFDNK